MQIPGLVAAIATIACLLSVDSNAGETRPDQPAAIGKPFRVSDSVTAYCAMKPPAMMCSEFKPLLAQFLAESRDAQWATPMEWLVAKSMLVKGRPWAEIRALECRRTLCALEYAVSVDDLDHDVDGDEELDRLMEPEGGVAMVPELPSGSGRGKLLNVLIWRKHS